MRQRERDRERQQERRPLIAVQEPGRAIARIHPPLPGPHRIYRPFMYPGRRPQQGRRRLVRGTRPPSHPRHAAPGRASPVRTPPARKAAPSGPGTPSHTSPSSRGSITRRRAAFEAAVAPYTRPRSRHGYMLYGPEILPQQPAAARRRASPRVRVGW